MPWPPETEAQDKLHAALFVVEELHGDKQAISILEQEINRIKVYGSLKAERQKLLAPPPSTPASAVADVNGIAVDALKFYGEETNYEPAKTGRDKRSAIAKDGGKMARDTLAALAEESE